MLKPQFAVSLIVVVAFASGRMVNAQQRFPIDGGTVPPMSADYAATGDPIWDGALIGAGTAAAASVFVYPHAHGRVALAGVAALIGAAWGAWIDFTIKDVATVQWTGGKSVAVRIDVNRSRTRVKNRQRHE
jgi:hypothetical protein